MQQCSSVVLCNKKLQSGLVLHFLAMCCQMHGELGAELRDLLMQYILEHKEEAITKP